MFSPRRSCVASGRKRAQRAVFCALLWRNIIERKRTKIAFEKKNEKRTKGGRNQEEEKKRKTLFSLSLCPFFTHKNRRSTTRAHGRRERVFCRDRQREREVKRERERERESSTLPKREERESFLLLFFFPFLKSRERERNRTSKEKQRER